MIVIDSSPLIAIIKNEHDAETYRSAIATASRIIIGAPTKLEVMMVSGGRFGGTGLLVAQDLLDQNSIETVDWTNSLADIAARAFMRFGKGRHKASLNFGDCMAYALAKSLDAPLLYKGGDFALTDIKSGL